MMSGVDQASPPKINPRSRKNYLKKRKGYLSNFLTQTNTRFIPHSVVSYDRQ